MKEGSILNKVENKIKDGPGWSVIGTFMTFEEANEKRYELSKQDNLQVKIVRRTDESYNLKKLKTFSEESFDVKTREKPQEKKDNKPLTQKEKFLKKYQINDGEL